MGLHVWPEEAHNNPSLAPRRSSSFSFFFLFFFFFLVFLFFFWWPPFFFVWRVSFSVRRRVFLNRKARHHHLLVFHFSFVFLSKQILCQMVDALFYQLWLVTGSCFLSVPRDRFIAFVRHWSFSLENIVPFPNWKHRIDKFWSVSFLVCHRCIYTKNVSWTIRNAGGWFSFAENVLFYYSYAYFIHYSYLMWFDSSYSLIIDFVFRPFSCVTLSCTEFYWVSRSFPRIYWILPSFTGFYLVFPGFTGFYLILPGFTRFYWVEPGFDWFLPGFTGFYRVLPSFTGFYYVLPGFTGFLLGFTGFYRFLPGFTGFYRVLPGFH